MAPIQLPTPNIAARCNQYVERTDGLHLSTILHDMLATLDPKRFGDFQPGGKNWAKIMAGLVFERALELAWLDRECQYRPGLVRIGEITTKEGIICTPDAVDVEGISAVEEYKWTKMSSSEGITAAKFWHWWTQVQFYCYVLELNVGRIWAMFVNGNYSRDRDDPAGDTQILGWQDTWTRQQLVNVHTMVVKHAQIRKML